jgi:hypothetical protein
LFWSGGSGTSTSTSDAADSDTGSPGAALAWWVLATIPLIASTPKAMLGRILTLRISSTPLEYVERIAD